MILDVNSTIILENDRVLLRPLSLEDFDELLHFSVNEPDLWTYSLTEASGKENLENYLKMALKDRANGGAYPFIAIDKRTNRVAGSTRFYDYQSVHNTIQLGYTWYGKEFHGTGLSNNSSVWC